MKRRITTPHTDEIESRLRAIAARDRETSERAREAKAKSVLTVRQLRALRLGKIEQDQAALSASLKGLEYRLGVHGEALDELETRLARLEAARLLRLQKGNPVR